MGGGRAIRWTGRALFVLGLVAAATWVAGEQTEVVVLRTFDAEGRAHETKLWVVDHDGAAWVRVANPEREWFRRLRAQPRVGLVRNGVAKAAIARPQNGSEARAAVDRAFREKYGLVDRWYGVLLRRDAIPVRLEPAP